MLARATAITSGRDPAKYVGSSQVSWHRQKAAREMILKGNLPRLNAFPSRCMSRHSTAGSAWGWVSWEGETQRKIVLLQNLNDARLVLRQPLTITVYTSVDTVGAYCFDLDELAVGDTEGEAIDEMRAMVADSYFLLKEHQNNLGRLQQAHWDFLREITEERAA